MAPHSPTPAAPYFAHPPSARLPPRPTRIVDNPDPRSPTRTRLLNNFGILKTPVKKFAAPTSIVSQASFPLPPEKVPSRQKRTLEDEPLSLYKKVKPVFATAAREHTTSLSDFHLFLDIDGTLVHTVPESGQNLMGRADFQIGQLGLASFKRPDLEQFMTFCFANFKSVSLWTAGVDEYAQAVAQNIAPSGCQFKFVLSRETLDEHPSRKPGACAKNLSAMCTLNEQFRTAGITRENCLIIDDTPEVCAWNTENAIIVPSWNAHGRHCARDTCFERLYKSFSQSCATNAQSLCSEASAQLRATAA